LFAYFIGNIYAKKISKSIHARQSYSKPKVGHLFETPGNVALVKTAGVSNWQTSKTLRRAALHAALRARDLPVT